MVYRFVCCHLLAPSGRLGPSGALCRRVSRGDWIMRGVAVLRFAGPCWAVFVRPRSACPFGFSANLRGPRLNPTMRGGAVACPGFACFAIGPSLRGPCRPCYRRRAALPSAALGAFVASLGTCCGPSLGGRLRGRTTRRYFVPRYSLGRLAVSVSAARLRRARSCAALMGVVKVLRGMRLRGHWGPSAGP